MKLAVRPLALACAILWGSAVFLVGVANLAWPTYGEAFLQLIASIYPGYHASGGVGSVGIGTLYAFLDGGVGGLILGLLYNTLVSKCGCHESAVGAESR